MTGLDYITGALEYLGVSVTGDSLDAADSSKMLKVLNRMLDSWSADLGPIFSETQESFALTSGDESYTIGPTGDFVTTRPIDLLRAKIRDASGYDYDAVIVSNREYQDIRLKDSGDVRPYVMSYNPTMPDATILFYPPPGSNNTLRLTSRKALADAVLASEYSVPEGYDNAIVLNLAVLAAPIYGRQDIMGSLMGMANEAYKIIRTNNIVIENVELDPMLPSQDYVVRSWKSDD